MLIPPRPDGGQAAWPETHTTTSLPHGFLYPLDIPSIHRILRPLKSKIAAVRRDIKSSPPFRFLLDDLDRSVETDKRTSEPNKTLRRRTVRERKQEQAGVHHRSTSGSKSRLSKPPPFQLEGEGQEAETNARAVEVLVKRYQSSLASLFKDALNRLWWRPFCDNNELPLNNVPSTKTTKAVRQQHSSLAILCAFSAGQTLSHVTDERKMEIYYESIPPHLRRFAVLSHIVEMCVCQIPVPQIKFHLAEICVKYRADDQALRFLDDLLRSTNSGFFGLDLVRAYQLLRLTDVSDAWIALACDHETSIRISATSLNELVPHAEKRHQPILARALVDHVVARSSAVQLDRQIMTSWTLSLIADSLVINNTRSEDPVVYFEEHERPSSQCDEAISSMARTLYTHPEAMMASGLEQIALALALHALYLLFTADSQLPDPQSSAILDWALLIDERTKQLQDDDLDVVLRAFKTLPNLLILVQVLDATELYSLAMTLLDRMIDDFAQLKRATNALYADSFKSNPITVRALESMIDDIEQRRLAAAAASGWYYDYDAGHWVQQEEEKDSVRSLTVDDGNTTDQLVTILSDNEDDPNDGIDSTRRRPLTRSTTRNSRRLSLFSSASPRKPPSATLRRRQAARTLAGDTEDEVSETERDLEIPDYLMAGHETDWIHSSSRRFSMVPYQRPTRATRKPVRYFDSDDEGGSLDMARSVVGSSDDEGSLSQSGRETASSLRLESTSIKSEASAEEEEEILVGKDRPSYTNEDTPVSECSDWAINSGQTSSLSSPFVGSPSPTQQAWWSEHDPDEAESLGATYLQNSDCTSPSSSSSSSSAMDVHKTHVSVGSGEEDSDGWFSPPKPRSLEAVIVPRKRQRKRRRAVNLSDTKSSGSASLSSDDSDGEYRPWIHNAPLRSARQARRRKVLVVKERTQGLRRRVGMDSVCSDDGDMEAENEGLQVRPPVGFCNFDSSEEDDGDSVDLPWEEHRERPDTGTSSPTEPSGIIASSCCVLEDTASDSSREGYEEEELQYSESDGGDEADDAEWLPSTRQSRPRLAQHSPSLPPDQKLLFAVGEPLPLTEADELAF